MTTFQIYRDVNGEWRWRAKKKGRITGDSAGDGYKRELTCRRVLNGLINDCKSGAIKINEL